MGQDLPKQFYPVRQRPVIYWVTSALLGWDRCASLTVVTHADYRKKLDESIQKVPNPGNVPIILTSGDQSRHGSTLKGIDALKTLLGHSSAMDDLVFIHDAARPTIDTEELDRLYSRFEDPECMLASLASPVVETIAHASSIRSRIESIPPRKELFSIKTPQAIRYSQLLKLLEIPENESFTDLLTWGLAGELEGYLVEASMGNVKLTTSADIPIIEALIERRLSMLRGSG